MSRAGPRMARRPPAQRRRPAARGAAMHHRMRSRRQSVRRQQLRRRRRVVLSAMSLAALAVVAVAVVRSPLFAISEIRVTGTSVERTGAVLDAAGIERGQNLLAADVDGARERVARLPWVREVEARRLPPSVVHIRVAQREATAVLVAGARAWLVDVDGVVLEGGSREGLPLLVADERLTPRMGERVGDDAVHNALAVHAALPGPLRSLVVRYDAPSVQGLRLLLDSGEAGEDSGPVAVRFGAAERTDAKARVVGLLLDEARRRGGAAAVLLDVRAPDHPVLVPGGHPDGRGS